MTTDYKMVHTLIGTASAQLVVAQVLDEQDESSSIKLLEAADTLGDIVQLLLGEVVQQEKIHTVSDGLFHSEA